MDDGQQGTQQHTPGSEPAKGARRGAGDLRSIPPLAGLDPDTAERLGARCQYVTYEPGETILDHADPSTDVRFVMTGDVRVLVRVTEGREYIMNDAGPGDFFGELSAIDGGGRSASVVAVTRVRCCLMPAPVFRDLVDADADVRWSIMERLTRLIRRLSDKLAEYSFLQAKHRVYIELMRLSQPRRGTDERVVTPPPVQRELADRIGSRREVVSRVLSEMERVGVLERTRGALVITDPERLEAMIRQGWEG